MRHTPSQNTFKKNLVALSVVTALSLLNTNVYAVDFIYKLGTPEDYKADINYVLKIDNNSSLETFDNIDIELAPPIANGRYTVFVADGKSLIVNGDTSIKLHATEIPKTDAVDIGTNALHAEGDGSTISLNGNVTIVDLHDVSSEDPGNTVGANAVYANQKASINLGSKEGTKTVVWALAEKPDAISAKFGGKVDIESTHNQIVGNIDTLQTDLGTAGSSITAKFSGSDSFWFGDEQTFSNVKSIALDNLVIFGKPLDNLEIALDGKDGVLKLLNEEFDELGIHENFYNLLSQVIKGIKDKYGKEFAEDVEFAENVELTFENGAQWTYFGYGELLKKDIADVVGVNGVKGEVSLTTIPKRISSITLNGGIVNLFDEDIQNKWKEIGLSDRWPELKVNHDYVRIGNLKGNGGIFRLDLNSDNRSKSDMIFIESDSAGTHFIEPYRPQDLISVSDSNRLTFALTSKDAAGVSFADKQNIYGESLYDYELWISSENITDENKAQFTKLVEDYYKDFDNFDIEDYVDGKYWFINRLTMKQSAAAVGMRSAGYASYDAAVSMDRHDRRLQDAVFQNESKEGLWTRIQYGEVGAEHLYNADLTTVYVGYETPTSDNNRLGVSFAYTDGNSDFQDLKGSGELKRYEASVYDTLTFGPHYLDFVARFGQVDNEFNVVNQSGALSTSGSFDQKYAAVSAEYGYRLIDTHNVFIEPQLQIQAAYLDDYSYKTERNMRVKAENDVSVIGRAGFRAGKYFRAADKTGELYARADVLHQFTDGQDAKFSDLESQVGVVWGDKDTWATFGIGGYVNWKDNVTVQLDVERTAGGETIDTWQVSGRLNYLF